MVDDDIVALNHNGDDVPSPIEGIRDPEFVVLARSEVPIISLDAGIAAANREVDDVPLLTEGMRARELDVFAGSGVPSIEVGEGVAATNSKGDDAYVLTEGRDNENNVATESDVLSNENDEDIFGRDTYQRQPTIAENVDEALDVLSDQSGSDNDDCWCGNEVGSDADADGEVAKRAEESNVVDMCSWSDGDHVVGEVEQHLTIDITYDVDNSFIDAYLGSIKKARDMITGQWSECLWDKKNLDIQAPLTSNEVYTLTLPLHMMYIP
jgi:hypothetical protein